MTPPPAGRGRWAALSGVIVASLLVGAVTIAAVILFTSDDDDNKAASGAGTSTPTLTPANQRSTATPTVARSSPSPATATATATSGRTATPSPTATPTATPTVTPTVQLPQGAIAGALTAAARRFDALLRPGSCDVDNPQRKSCIWVADGPKSTPDLGTAVLLLSGPGGGGAILIYGRFVTGEWDLWFSTQNNFYQLMELPGQMIVCADGQGANVRPVPTIDGAPVRLLPDLSKVTVDLVVLLQSATRDKAGEAWYRLSAPVFGWIRSDLLAAASLGNCDLRNQMHTSY